MTCAVYLPTPTIPSIPPPTPSSAGTETTTYPALMYLSGLTCNDENVCQKSGVFRILSSLGLAFIAPDTSPRVNLPGDSDSWDFGKGAGFYLDATQEPWSGHYKMSSYLTEELPEILSSNFPLNLSKLSLTGHSMGGHGALTLALKFPHLYQSVSAFAPICNPINCPWGQKAFQNYLGNENQELWKEYDACELLQSRGVSKYEDILIDVGLADGFLEKQLKPSNLMNIASSVGQNITLRQHEGYDHSYYFISSFIEDHVRFHAKYLLGTEGA
jgi:S-formylglutathione hydrolase